MSEKNENKDFGWNQEEKDLQNEMMEMELGENIGRKKAEKIEKKRDTDEIRKLLFAGLISGMLFLIALAMRDFITETVYDYFPKDKGSTRLIAFLAVIMVALLIVFVVYYNELDL